MITPHTPDKEDRRTKFIELFRIYENTLNGQKDYVGHAIQKSAIQRLSNDVDFPTRKNEDWKYTSVAEVLEQQYRQPKLVDMTMEDIRPFLFKGLDVFLLVFVNGKYNKTLSAKDELPKSIIVQDISSGLKEDGLTKAISFEYLSKWAKKEKNPFIVLNTAFAQNGTFIYVPDGLVLDRPIHILNINFTKDEPIIISPQKIIAVGENSKLTVIETYHHLNNPQQTYFTNTVSQMVLKRNAVVDHYRIQDEGEHAFFINNTEVEQMRESIYSSYVVDLGGQLVRNNLSSILMGSGTTTNFYGIYVGRDKQHIDNQTFIDHAYPNCNSNELYKGILTDSAKGVFNGKIMVRPDAQKTNAFQKNHTLVLSKAASMNSKPQLEIFADDVKCSHGATIGQLNEEALYYMRSRGLSKKEAISVLKQAFLTELTELIQIEPVREKIEQMLLNKFKLLADTINKPLN
ncbi:MULTISPECIES: Fe-S cluster assembly protein SufD [unclassified Mucilaginibacter]|uniref:Fe-S cluster assembly protein SufD n=1 Tax=unclassified Mucilaginibacter TaxID=2617802 RepID=UPI0019B7CF19|nr:MULTISPECIES: Fe-S cluster assembly protein SufD [unclassified Mucilaginibacter]MBC7389021.1 Fe-S cluster assembly protein SufD [Cytophagales bacterium]MEB0260056.1 Fe-S cluster assembly protein SufD [Mucilaginibacter sp. 10I4]MEB0280560.1 Fe-S cluster assembly protein SufD [Mucilaginibacter sp. 10B2]MEB0301100.1 Fe-S cluster assembly protein SufD [Mucilaginibacter sp. 5C4]WPX22408.1 Fe-S cluster assembly protein SufD [Mucilaginibacter sp. 5C4]